MNVTESFYSLDDKIIGFLYISTSLTIMIFYIPCIIICATDSDYKSHSCIQIMVHLGICDVTNLTGQIILGVWSLTGHAFTVPNWLNRLVVTVFTQVTWTAYISLTHLVALNRCAVQCFSPSWRNRLFSNNSTKVLVGFCWLYAFAFGVVLLSPYAAMVYSPNLFVYYFDFSMPYTLDLIKFNWWNCVITLGMTCFWYLVTLIALRKEIRDLSQSDQVHDSTLLTERSFLKQALIICLSLILTDQYWHNGADWVCPLLGIYCYPLGNMLVILNCGVNPLVYLAMNKTLSNKVKQKFLGKKVVPQQSQPVKRTKSFTWQKPRVAWATR